MMGDQSVVTCGVAGPYRRCLWYMLAAVVAIAALILYLRSIGLAEHDPHQLYAGNGTLAGGLLVVIFFAHRPLVRVDERAVWTRRWWLLGWRRWEWDALAEALISDCGKLERRFCKSIQLADLSRLRMVLDGVLEACGRAVRPEPIPVHADGVDLGIGGRDSVIKWHLDERGFTKGKQTLGWDDIERIVVRRKTGLTSGFATLGIKASGPSSQNLSVWKVMPGDADCEAARGGVLEHLRRFVPEDRWETQTWIPVGVPREDLAEELESAERALCEAERSLAARGPLLSLLVGLVPWGALWVFGLIAIHRGESNWLMAGFGVLALSVIVFRFEFKRARERIEMPVDPALVRRGRRWVVLGPLIGLVAFVVGCLALANLEGGRAFATLGFGLMLGLYVFVPSLILIDRLRRARREVEYLRSRLEPLPADE